MDMSEFSEATKRWRASGRMVDVLGRYEVFVHERGSGPNVLLIHGFPTSSYDWVGVVDGLADGFRCVAPDLLGLGLSDKPEAFSYSLFQLTDAVEDVVAGRGMREAHVVSHDIGTSVHTELLARQQRGRVTFEISSSTFLNGSMLQGLATITPIQKLLGNNETLDQAIEICNNMGQNYIQGLQAVMQKPDCLSEDDIAVMNDLIRYRNGNRRLPALSVYMRERYIHRERWISALKAADPIQFVWATGDPVANIEMGRALHAEVPQARYSELEGLGHFLLMEDPRAVAAKIREFIA
jgi:pimeloyl-ACP methyl ester carboxylesterase